jgi:hypothetical protein
MGYTHSWEVDPKHPQFLTTWPQILTDAERIAAHAQSLGIKLADGMGKGAPVIDSAGVYLNGPSDGDLDGDTFSFDPEPWLRWSDARRDGEHVWADGREQSYKSSGFDARFCKTKRLPYDVAVCAILLRARFLAPAAVFICSGGSWQQEWRHGAEYIGGATDGCGPSARDVVEELFAQRETKDPLGARRDLNPPARSARPSAGKAGRGTATRRP